jgi:hypothetical protein
MDCQLKSWVINSLLKAMASNYDLASHQSQELGNTLNFLRLQVNIACINAKDEVKQYT